MKRGRRPDLPSTKQARGTFQPCRDGGKTEIVAPMSLPMQPPWLTEAGQEVWLDDIGRVAPGRLISERDSTMFANYCNLQGAIVIAWRLGAVPPAAHMAEARRLAEQFGLFGAKSRMMISEGGVSADNPFAHHGRRPA
jgi:hypothetical protein